jgi:formamidopyrimidine-DNA glycosylase
LQWVGVKDAIEDALAAGIDAKGASIDDFRHVDGARGSFQDRFLVHRREGEPCTRCGRPVRKIVVGGRGTYVCERCQRKPRRTRNRV